MTRKEIEDLIKENFKDTALRIYELDNEDRKRRFLLNLKVKVLLHIFFTVSINYKKNTF